VAASIPQRIIHVELSGEFPNLVPDRAYPVFYVVFWWYGIPLGHVEIASLQLPMSASHLKQVAARTIAPVIISHLQEWGLSAPDVGGRLAQNDFAADDVLRHWEEPFAQWRKQRFAPNNTSMSVVICTRDRPEFLKRCLRSLQTLSHPPEEIVVVDNAPSSTATQQLVKQFPRIKYILGPKPGLDVARNTGVNNSTGNILAYLDDDVIVHPDWSLHLRQAFQNPQVMAVTGLVIAAALETEAQCIFEKYWSFNRGYQTILYDSQYFDRYNCIGVPAWRVGAGANMAFRRRIFDLVGNFDERLDVGAAGCSGDSELWYRILAEKWTCRYEPTAVAYHWHRQEMSGLRKQVFNYMRGHITELLIRFEKYKHWGNIIRLVLLPIHFSRVVIIGLLKDKLRLTTFKEEIRGCFSGIKYYFHNK
jgi:glycosyltransferase involved in cell wall biosynthesis